MSRKLPIFFFVILLQLSVYSQDGFRKHFTIPDADGYYTLKCDFHMHTVFSDGLVWPTLRVLEAWNEGLDAIAITDHLEYRPFREDISADHNRSYEIARAKADELGIILIKGAEITRKMPPGHSNALFVSDINLLATEKWEDAFTEAKKQDAFIFWNHPGWKAQQPDTMRWFPEHTSLYEDGKMNGIEIVNYMEYYPEAFQWALDKNLTILGNSDIHGSIYQEYDVSSGRHRPITLVFSREESLKGIKDALFDGRTAVLYNGTVYGRQEWVNLLFKACVGIQPDRAAFTNDSRRIMLTNYSSLDLSLTPTKAAGDFGLIYPVVLPAHSTVLLLAHASGNADESAIQWKVEFFVDNMLVGPHRSLKVNLKF